MLNGHLSPHHLDLYHRGVITLDEEREVHSHLSVCQECRAMLSRLDGLDAELDLFLDELEIESLEGSGHLEYEQLIAYIEGDLDEIERHIDDSHLEVCSPCDFQLRELSTFKNFLKPKT